MFKKIWAGMIIFPLIIPILFVNNVQTAASSYDYAEASTSFLSGEGVGEDLRFTIYHTDFPSSYAYEVESVCFVDTDGYYTGDCISNSDFTVGRTKIDENYSSFIEFIAPGNFGIDISPVGYIEVYTNDEYYYAYYEIDNYLYPLGADNYLIQGQEITLCGYNIADDNLYIDGQKIDVTVNDYSNYCGNEEIVFTIPTSVDEGDMTIQFKSPYSNKIAAYIIPNEFNDTYQENQWYLIQSEIYEAYLDYNPTEEVVVAVIDSGIDIGHPDLDDSIWINEDEISGNGIDDDGNEYIDDVYGWTYRYGENGYIIDPSSYHGTFVAGIIAANQNNGIGITGIARNTKIMSLDIIDEYGSVNTDYIIDAIYYAADNGADIINLSLGGAVYNSYTTEYNDAIEYAYKKGCLIVVASGNGMNNNINSNGTNLNNVPASPVCNDGDDDLVLGVAAADWDNVITDFSNYGSDCVDSSALGEYVYSTTWVSNGSYGYNDGTSFAAPIVAGVAAMIKGQFPELENWQIQYLIEKTGKDIDNLDGNSYYNGQIGTLVNAKNAFDNAESLSYPSKPDILSDIDSTENIVEDRIFSDVDDFHSNVDAIEYLYENGIISGYLDGTFKPEYSVNRAELLKILVGGQGITPDSAEYNNCFPDVTDEWYAPYICYAKDSGWVGGYPDGTFQPANNVNKVEALKMLINSMELDSQLAVLVTEDLFSDTDNSAWYASYVKLAKDIGILEEKGNIFTPEGNMDRGGICENLFRILVLQLTGQDLYTEDLKDYI